MKIGFLGDIYTSLQCYTEPDLNELPPALRQVDHLVANLEAPLVDALNPINKKGPVMAQDPGVITLLEALGVNVVGLANNHIADHGKKAIEETVNSLSKKGFHCGGAGASIDQAYRSVRVEEAGHQVALIFAGENGFGCCTPFRESYGYAWIFSSEFEAELACALSECSAVVVVVHGGTEHTEQPLPQWRSVFRSLINRGVSAVVAHHPHVTQGVETYKHRPIFYSIGNFYFSKDRSVDGWYNSQVPVLEFRSGSLVDWNVHHTQYSLNNGGRIWADQGWGPERTRRLSGALINDLEYDEALIKDLSWLWKKRYGPGVERSLPFAISGRHFLLGLARRTYGFLRNPNRGWQDPMILEHFFDIESHRWAIAEIMRLKRQGNAYCSSFVGRG